MNEKLQSLRDKILEKIKTGEAQMRPRWHFALKAALMIVGAVIVVITLVYIFSFVIFVLRNNGVWFVPAFGFRGIGIFLMSLPWVIILAGLVFVGILEILVRHYSFAYRRPLLFSLSGIIALALVGSIVISQTPLHEKLFSRAQHGRLPFAGGLYRGYGMQRDQDAHKGVIKEFNENGFKMEGRLGDDFVVIVTPETQYPSGVNFQEEDMVLVLGKSNDGTIQALGVIRVDQNMRPRTGRYPGWFRPQMLPR